LRTPAFGKPERNHDLDGAAEFITGGLAMKRLKIKQVDVFTKTPLCGNPAAVVMDARGLAIQEMQAIAREMNLSETTFVLPATSSESDYRLRIFTPRSELPFAGHPTIATVHAIIEEGRLFNGRVPSLVKQECGIGIVTTGLEKKDAELFFMVTHAEPQWTRVELGRQHSADMIGCREDDFFTGFPLEIVSTGVQWLIMPLRTLRAVKTLSPNMDLVEKTCAATKAVGVTVFASEAERSGHAVHVRSFAPGLGITEDPVCGTGNGAVAAYIAKHALMSGEKLEYLAEQGLEVQRPGTVLVKAERQNNGGWRIQVGGQAVTVLEGEIQI
jgi:PhzF family phenazine biosynthesis protein